MILFIIIACQRVSHENLPRKKELRMLIAESIQHPYSEVDTLLLEPQVGMCGNSSQEEYDRFYEPYLAEDPFLSVLRANFKGVILINNGDLNLRSIEKCKTYDCQKNVWKAFVKNKLRLSISGKVNNNTSLTIYETYTFNEDVERVEKEFEFKDGQWTFVVVEYLTH